MNNYEEEITKKIEEIINSGEMEHSELSERISELTDKLVIIRKIEAEIVREINTLISDSLPLATSKEPDTRKIDVLRLSARTYRCLFGRGGAAFEEPGRSIRTISDMLDVPKHRWHCIRGFGKVMAMEVEEKMHEAGYTDFYIIN
ncbi:hypothetical protein IKF23_02280 [Candidatus Saccharibacteria bacterium]|nr:hypothetical protein [Candidatus Saccharibacteria bacterium]